MDDRQRSGIRERLRTLALVAVIVGLVYLAVGPWSLPGPTPPAPVSTPVASSSQPSPEQQRRIEAALGTVALIAGGVVVIFAVLVVGASVYLRRRRPPAGLS